MLQNNGFGQYISIRAEYTSTLWHMKNDAARRFQSACMICCSTLLLWNALFQPGKCTFLELKTCDNFYPILPRGSRPRIIPPANVLQKTPASDSVLVRFKVPILTLSLPTLQLPSSSLCTQSATQSTALIALRATPILMPKHRNPCNPVLIIHKSTQHVISRALIP